MSEMTLGEARAKLGEAVDTARGDHDPVFLTHHGRRVAAIIDSDDLERLIEAAEDLVDIRAAREARAERETSAAPIPWEKAKADLGLG